MTTPMLLKPLSNDRDKLLEVSSSFTTSRLSCVRTLANAADPNMAEIARLLNPGRAVAGPAQTFERIPKGKSPVAGPQRSQSRHEPRQVTVKSEEADIDSEVRHSTSEHNIDNNRDVKGRQISSKLHIPLNRERVNESSAKVTKSNVGPVVPQNVYLFKSNAHQTDLRKTDSHKTDSHKTDSSKRPHLQPLKEQRMDAILSKNEAPEALPKSEPESESPVTYRYTTPESCKTVSYVFIQGIIILLCLVIFIALGQLGVGAVSDWYTRSCMSNRNFAFKGDMRPWMKTYNRHILHDLAQLDTN